MKLELTALIPEDTSLLMNALIEKPDVVVVLAAGFGSRLRSDVEGPKPLRLMGGRALILRTLDRFIELGVQDAIVVLGHRKDEVKLEIEKAKLACRVTFVENPKYEMGNGLSVLAAKSAVQNRAFFLSMSDHIFEQSLLEELVSTPLPERGLVLAVDRKLSAIYDMDDAMKVRTKGDRIVEIGKSLDNYDSIDTGLFMCDWAVFSELEKSRDSNPKGDCSISDAVRSLAANGLAKACDIGKGLWQDVDTPGSKAHAEKLFKL